MYKVICDEIEEFVSLDLAMNHAKKLNKFVKIQGDDFEVVGVFGVDSVQNGLCPDGVKYDWNKESRIGSIRRTNS